MLGKLAALDWMSAGSIAELELLSIPIALPTAHATLVNIMVSMPS